MHYMAIKMDWLGDVLKPILLLGMDQGSCNKVANGAFTLQLVSKH